MMTPLDYGRTFLIGKAPANEVRFWAESRTRIIDEEAGTHEDYVQCAACKSEDTFAESDLFYEDNYDFIPVFGPEWGIIFRRHVWLDTGYKTCQPVLQMWEGQRYHLVEASEFDELVTNEVVREAAYAFQPIVAQTEIWNQKTKLRAIIEYPVKTLNTHRERNLFQVDTGPIAYPDISKHCDRHVDRISLAFVAFNVPHFADFVCEVPTPIMKDGKEICRVHHYSERVSVAAKNTIYCLGKL